MPLATPNTLTEKHQTQSLASCSHGRPPPPDVTPALLKRRWHAPSVENTSVRERLDRRRRRDVGHHAAHLADVGQLLHRGLEDGLFDVGDDDPRPLLEQGLDDAAADAARSPGHHGHPAVQVVQRVCPQSSTTRVGGPR